MTIHEIQERKAQLESAIADLVAAFQKETRCSVSDIEVSRVDCTVLGGGPGVIVTGVRTTVVVP